MSTTTPVIVIPGARRRPSGCAPTCPGRHPEFRGPINGRANGLPDRAERTWAAAIALAFRRAGRRSRERQTVRRHVGNFTGRVWLVQSVRTPEETR